MTLLVAQMMAERRFPAPWSVEEYRGISYIVRDANNFAVAYVYFETEPGRRAAANLMTKDEARKIAAGIAKAAGAAEAAMTSACADRPIECAVEGKVIAPIKLISPYNVLYMLAF